jgi:hypothetical protein
MTGWSQFFVDVVPNVTGIQLIGKPSLAEGPKNSEFSKAAIHYLPRLTAPTRQKHNLSVRGRSRRPTTVEQHSSIKCTYYVSRRHIKNTSPASLDSRLDYSIKFRKHASIIGDSLGWRFSVPIKMPLLPAYLRDVPAFSPKVLSYSESCLSLRS